MADPLSITTGCLSLIGVISKLSLQITLFAVDVHEALNDMAALRQELNSFSFSLDVLPHLCEDGSAPYPEDLKGKLAGVIGVCGTIIKNMKDLLEKMSSGSLGRRIQWATYGRNDMEKLRENLKGHVLGVDIVMHTINHLLIKSIKQDTEQIKRDTSAIKDDTRLVPEIKEDTSQIKELLVKIHAQAPRSGENYMLSRYLTESITYAESVINDSIGDNYDEDQELFQPSHLLFAKPECNEEAFKITETNEMNEANDKSQAPHTLNEHSPNRPTSPPAGNALTTTPEGLGPPLESDQLKPVDDDPELPPHIASQVPKSALVFTDTGRMDAFVDDDLASQESSDDELAQMGSVPDTKHDAKLSCEDDVPLTNSKEDSKFERIVPDTLEDEVPKHSRRTEAPPTSEMESSISTIQPLEEDPTHCAPGQREESENGSLDTLKALPNSLDEDTSFIQPSESNDPLVSEKEAEDEIIDSRPSANAADISPSARSTLDLSRESDPIESSVKKADKTTVDVATEEPQLTIRLVSENMQRWITCSSLRKLASIEDKIPALARTDTVDLLSVKVGWRVGSKTVEGPFNLVKEFSFQELGFVSQNSIYFAVAYRMSESRLFHSVNPQSIVSAKRSDEGRVFLRLVEIQEPAADSSLEVEKSHENTSPVADEKSVNPVQENDQVAAADSLGDQTQQTPTSSMQPLPKLHHTTITRPQLENLFFCRRESRESYMAALTFSTSFNMLQTFLETLLSDALRDSRDAWITLETIKHCLIFGSEAFVQWAGDVRLNKHVFAKLLSIGMIYLIKSLSSKQHRIQTLARDIDGLLKNPEALKEKRTPLTDEEVESFLGAAVRELNHSE